MVIKHLHSIRGESHTSDYAGWDLSRVAHMQGEATKELRGEKIVGRKSEICPPSEKQKHKRNDQHYLCGGSRSINALQLTMGKRCKGRGQ